MQTSSKESSANKLNFNVEKKSDLISQIEKLDEKKINKVFKYIEKLSDYNIDPAEMNNFESKNFVENNDYSIKGKKIFV